MNLNGVSNVEEFLERQGIAGCIQDSVKELLVNRPPEKDQDAIKFISNCLGEMIGVRTKFDKAVRLVVDCNPRTGLLAENAAEAFMILASTSNRGGGLGCQGNELEPDIDTVCIQPCDLREFVTEICREFSVDIQLVLLPLVQVDIKQKYLISFNEFMCTINPCIIVKEMVRTAEAEFDTLDVNDDGLIETKLAIDYLTTVNWEFPHGCRRRKSTLPFDSANPNKDDNKWQSSAIKITQDLPACPFAPPKNIELLHRAERILFEHEKAGQTNKKMFTNVVLLCLSPLHHYAKTWMQVQTRKNENM